jgi:hypothetical protein
MSALAKSGYAVGFTLGAETSGQSMTQDEAEFIVPI